MLLLLTALALAQAGPPLPAAWHGEWAGTMTNTGPTGKSAEVPVRFKIEPIMGTRDVTWVMTYDGPKKLVKDYILTPDGDKPGRFLIDEKNGVALPARLVGNVLYSQFEVGGSVLTARYELRGDRLHFEVTSAKTGKAEKGVTAYAVDVVQAVEFKKK